MINPTRFFVSSQTFGDLAFFEGLERVVSRARECWQCTDVNIREFLALIFVTVVGEVHRK